GGASASGGPGSAGGPGTMLAPEVEASRRATLFPDLSVRELAVLAPLVALILLLGFYPQPVLEVINPSVGATLSEVGLTDPVSGQQGGN
ncbi:MAG: NADH-quinone oxidoreductase subunit M, partial [Pseudonocardiaceae bacterium]